MMHVLVHLLSPSSEMYIFLQYCVFCKFFSSSTLAAEWCELPVIRRRDSGQGITFLQSGSISFNQLFPLATYYLLVTLRYSLNWSSLTLGSLSQSRRSQPQSRRMVRAELNWSDKFACLVDNAHVGCSLVPVWYLVGWTGWVEANSRSVSTSIGSWWGWVGVMVSGGVIGH